MDEVTNSEVLNDSYLMGDAFVTRISERRNSKIDTLKKSVIALGAQFR